MTDNKALLPFANTNENDSFSLTINPDANLSHATGLLFKLEKQNEEISSFREEAKKIVSFTGVDYVSETFDSFAKKWTESLSQIELLAKQKDFEGALSALDSAAKEKIHWNEAAELASTQEADFIVRSLRCRLEAMRLKAKAKDGLTLEETEVTNHYYNCLALPLDLEGKEGKERIVDEARGFVYAAFAEICRNCKEDYKAFASSLPHWKMALSEEPISKSTRAEKDEFEKSFASCYNAQAKKAFSLDRDFERALELFRFRNLLKKDALDLPPYRYAYDEDEFHLYFCEDEALGKDDESFAPSIAELVAKIKSADDFEFHVLSHLLALPGVTKRRFNEMVGAIKPLSFELKIQLLSSSMALGMEPLRTQEILRSVEKTRLKSLDLEALAKPLLFIKDHLNDALLARFLPILEDILRSPKAHKVIVKSNSLALHSLIGESQEMPRLSLGKAMKNTRVRSWGSGKLVCYIIFGIILPIFALSFASAFLYLYNGISDTHASLYAVLPMMGMLIFVLATIDAWMGFDERGSALTRKILLGDSLWKALLAASYFVFPASLPGLDRVRYALLAFALIESFLAFFLLKPVKKKALLDYLLFGATFTFSMLGVAYMIIDMMHGII